MALVPAAGAETVRPAASLKLAMQRRDRRGGPSPRTCISVWERSEPAVYPHPTTNHWAKLKYQMFLREEVEDKTRGLTLSIPQSSPPYYQEKCSRFRYDGCLSSVAMSRISDYLTDEYTELKPGAYPATKPRIPPQFANPYQELKLSSLKYWMEQDNCGNMCPIAQKKLH